MLKDQLLKLGLKKSEWHIFKTILVCGHYNLNDKTKKMYIDLDKNLRNHNIGKLISEYLKENDQKYLDKAAFLLTESNAAWIVLERL